MSDWVNCLHDNSWFTLAPFLYHPNLFETFALPYCIKFFSFFNVFVGVKWNSSTHLLRCFFFGSLYFIGFKLSGQKCFSIVVSTFLYSTKLITIIIVCRRADRIPQYLLININSKQIQYHCILLKMLLFLLFQTLWLQNFYIV